MGLLRYISFSSLLVLVTVFVLNKSGKQNVPRRLVERKPNGGKDAYEFDRIWEPIQYKLCPNMTPNTDMGLNLFALARTEIGLQPWGETAPNEPFFDHFFNEHHGGLIYSVPDDGVNIAYLYVWKAAHLQLRGWFRNILSDLPGDFQEIERKNLGKAIRDLKQKHGNVCVITAIRDPISHFLSGYNEIEFLMSENRASVGKGAPDLLFTRYQPGQMQRFRDFVADVLGGPTLEGWKTYNALQIAHIYSMSAVLAMLEAEGVNLTSYLPTLKNLGDEWPHFVSKTCPGLPEEISSTPMRVQGQHKSSMDRRGTYEAAKQVFAENGPTARALCVLHAMDYACWTQLPNGIPDICKQVYSSHSFVDGILEASEQSAGR